MSGLHETKIGDDTIEFESCRVESEIPWKYFDVFVNCAHVDFKQTELLNEAYNEWKNDNRKLIINISSRMQNQTSLKVIFMHAEMHSTI